MEINKFAAKVCNFVERELGKGYQAEVKKVKKNNGVILHGLLIMAKEQNVTPTIYLEPFWEIYQEGMSFESVVRWLLTFYRENTPHGKIEMEFFRTFEKVKDRICYRLISRKGNEELLQDLPYIEFLDLALCFYYAYQGENLGEGAILIHNSHLEMWEVCVEEVLKLAQINTPRLFPCTCSTMDDILKEITDWDFENEEKPAGAEPDCGSLAEIPMMVLGNAKRQQGAVSMIYPGVLEKLAEKEQRSFYIIPSSVHEVVLLADTGQEKAEEIKKMIIEVNSTQVAPEDVLSDSLYYYDSAKKKIKIIF